MTPPSFLSIVRKGFECRYWRQEVYFAIWLLSLPDIPTSCLQAFLCNEKSQKHLSGELSFSPYQIAPGLSEKLGVRRLSRDICRSAYGENFVLETLKWAEMMSCSMGGHLLVPPAKILPHFIPHALCFLLNERKCSKFCLHLSPIYSGDTREGC